MFGNFSRLTVRWVIFFSIVFVSVILCANNNLIKQERVNKNTNLNFMISDFIVFKLLTFVLRRHIHGEVACLAYNARSLLSGRVLIPSFSSRPTAKLIKICELSNYALTRQYFIAIVSGLVFVVISIFFNLVVSQISSSELIFLHIFFVVFNHFSKLFIFFSSLFNC